MCSYSLTRIVAVGLLSLGLSAAAPMARAAGNFMATVTAESGKIMAGDNVLAELPRGRQIWIFDEHDDGYDVKVPASEQHGRIAKSSVERVQRTDEQKAELQRSTELNDAADKLKAEKKFAESRAAMQKCLEIERRIYGNSHPDVASSLSQIAYRSQDLRDLRGARQYLTEALAIRREVLGNNHPLTITTMTNLGYACQDLADLPAARKLFEEVVALRRKTAGNDDQKTANALDNLGIVAVEQADFATARKAYEEELAIRRKHLGKDDPEIAHVLNNMGMMFKDSGDPAAARRAYEEALSIYRKAYGKEHLDTARALSNLGTLFFAQGDYKATRAAHEEALAIRRKLLGNDNQNVANSLNNLAGVAMRQDDYPTARKLLEEALAISRKNFGNDHPRIGLGLCNLANLACDEKDYATGRKLYEEALAIDRKAYGEEHPETLKILSNLAVLARDEKDYPKSRELSGKVHAVRVKVLGPDHPDTSLVLNHQATAAALQGDLPAAGKLFDQVRRGVRRYTLMALPALSAAEQLAFLENKFQGRWFNSLSLGWQARENAELRSLSASWLINGKAITQESLAARELLLRDATDPQLAPQVRELQDIRQKLAALALSTPKPSEAAARLAKIADLTAEEQRLARALSSATGSATAPSEWVELDQVRRAIPANAIYIDLVRMKILDFQTDLKSAPHYLAWIIPADGQGEVTILDLGAAAPIEAAVEKARASLAASAGPTGALRKEGEKNATEALVKELQAVSDLVLKPLQPYLANKQQVILSPDGSLWLLPWAALPSGEQKILLEQVSVRLVLSGRDLIKPTQTSKLGVTAPAIIVNPDYDLGGPAAKTAIKGILPNANFDETATRGEVSRSSLPQVAALPFTVLEGLAAESTLAALAQSKPVLYQQEQALEAVVKTIKHPRYALFSTHGFFLPDQESKAANESQQGESSKRSVPVTIDGQTLENPLLRCGLLFAGCNQPRTPGLDDGILTGLEIVGMDLRGTELVVLSACETGIGKVRNGEGVAGLRQAFQLAGAQSVVSTLWQVPDRDSALIMQDFFKNLAAGQSKADALRNAQLKRIAARKDKSGAAHPFFWAAWTVTGE